MKSTEQKPVGIDPESRQTSNGVKPTPARDIPDQAKGYTEEAGRWDGPIAPKQKDFQGKPARPFTSPRLAAPEEPSQAPPDWQQRKGADPAQRA